MAGTSSRSYYSPRRQEAAQETRRAVLEAARQEFVAHGYAGTTLAAIARSAGVSLPTVKLVAGTKPQLLVAAIQALIRRDDVAVPLVEQPWWRQMLRERNPEALLGRFVSTVRLALEGQAELFEVVRQAAPSEPEIAALAENASLGRWHDQHQVVQALSIVGALRQDLEVDAATDIIWALSSPTLYRLLVRDRGWPPERWEEWLLDNLTRQLLAHGGSP